MKRGLFVLVLLGWCTFTEALLLGPRQPCRLAVSAVGGVPSSMSAAVSSASSTPANSGGSGGGDSGAGGGGSGGVASVAYKSAATLESAATAAVSPLGTRPLGPEAVVLVRPAGPKGMGMGAFAGGPIAKGSWLGNYQGELTTLEESLALYAGAGNADNRTDYIMCMSKERGLYRDE